MGRRGWFLPSGLAPDSIKLIKIMYRVIFLLSLFFTSVFNVLKSGFCKCVNVGGIKIGEGFIR